MSRGRIIRGRGNKKLFRAGYNRVRAKNVTGQPMMRGGSRL